MGLDGGTVITRSDVLRGQSWRMAQQDTSRSTRGGSVSQTYQEQQLDEQTRRAVLWSTCALSGLPLVPPIVADALGQLMNRQVVLEHLLAVKSVKQQQQQQPQAVAAAACGADATALSSGPAAAAAGPVPAICGRAAGRQPQAPGVVHAGPAAAAAAAAAAGGGGGEEADEAAAAARLRYENQLRAALAAAGPGGQPGAAFDHIRSLKDVFAVTLTRGGGQQGHQQQQHGQEACGASEHHHHQRQQQQEQGAAPSWVCPVTLLPCGGKQPFSALRPCGHVLSDKALAAIGAPAAAGAAARATTGPGKGAGGSSSGSGGSSGSSSGRCCVCPVCDAAFDPAADVVAINGSRQHMDAVREQLRARGAARADARLAKRERKWQQGQEEQQQRQLLLPLADGKRQRA